MLSQSIVYVRQHSRGESRLMGNGDGVEIRVEQGTISTYRGFDPDTRLVRHCFCAAFGVDNMNLRA